MNNDFRAIIQIAYDMAKGNKQLQADIKKIQEQYKIKFKAELDDKSALNSIKQMEKYQDSFNKKNLNGIDLEIKKREEQSRLFSSQIKSQMQERVSAENKIQAELKQTAKEQQNAFNLDIGKSTLDNRISSYLKNNSKLSVELKNRLVNIQSQLKSVDKVGLDRLKKEFRETTSAANALGRTGDTIFARLKKNSAQFLNYLGSATLIMGSIRTFQNIVEEIKNIDSAMVNLKKVTDETNTTYEKFLTNTAQKAKELGASISDLVNATADFARLGYNLPDSAKLGEVATLYKNVGDGIDIGGATSSIISTLKAFNIEAENSISIVDKFNEVGNNFAISSVGIGEALQRSASALASANNTLDESIALITAGNNVVQDPNMVGTALKTVSLRLRSTATEIENLGEDAEGAVENVSDLRDLLLALTNQKVDIQLDEDTYKSTYQIMLEMSKVWDSMTDMSQASALESMFGKRQANIGASILQNMSEAEDVLKTSIESTGSALREQEKYQEGIQYSLDRLKASTQELSMTTLDSSIIKAFVDLANGAVNATTAIGGLVPVITTLGIAFGVHKFLLPILVKEMSALLLAETGVTATTMSQIVAQTGLNGAVALGTTAIRANTTALLTWMATNPIGQVLALGTAVTGLVLAYNKYNTTMERLTEASNLAISNFNSLKDAADSNANKVENLASKYESLSKGVNNLGENISLTTDEYSEYNNIVNEIADMFPELITGYTNQGDAILSLKGNVESLRDAYKEAQLEAYNLLIANGENADGDDIISQYKELFRDESSLEKTSSYFGHTSTSDAIDALNKLLNATTGSVDDFKNLYNELYAIYGDDFDKISNAIDTSDWAKWTEDDLRNMVHIIKSNIQTLQSDINSSLSNVRTLANAYLMTNEDYDNLDEQSKTAVSLIVNSINEGIASGFDSKVDVGAYVSKLISSVNNNQEVKDALTNLFTVDFSKMSLDEAKSEIDRYIGILSDILGEDKNELKIRLGFDNVKVDEISDSISDSISRIKPDAFDTLNKSLDDLDKKSKDTVSSVKELNQILYDQSQGTKLTSEQAYKLITQYPQLASALEKTTDGYVINEEAIEDVRLALIEQEKTNAQAQLNMTKDTLDAVKDRVKAYGIELEAITNIQSAMSEQGNLPWQKIFGTMDGVSFNDETMRVTNPMGSFIAQSKEQYDKMKQSYQEQKLIYDTVGKMGNLRERINGLQNDLLSDKGFGVNEGKGGSGKEDTKDPIKDAFDLGTKDKKGNWITGKNDLDHQLAMEEITQKQYLDGVEKINKATYGKNKKTHLENYRQYLEEVKKGRDQIAKKLAENKIKSKFNDLEYEHEMGLKTDDKYWKIKLKYAEKYYKKNGEIIDEYLDEYRSIQSGYYKWTQQQAEETAKKQEKIAENLKDKYTDLIGDIADEIKKEKDDVLDSLDESHKRTIKNLEEQKDNYKEIVETQLELLDAKKKQNDYEKSITKQTKEISKIESRKAELEKAAKSGDRTAIAELAKLDEDLAKKKEDLSDEQSDHEYDLQKESLNNALDLNDKLMDARIDAENTRFETQKSNIERLYDEEIKLINNAAQHTKDEFGRALDEIAIQLASNGVTQSSDYLGVVKKSQSSIAGSEIDTSTANRSAILSILSNGNGKDYKEEASALASYTRDNYGNPIFKKQAVDVAKLLGVSGINSVGDLTGNDENKNKILEALRKAKFSKGGYVDARSVGEDGFALVKHGEPILTVEQGKLFKELIKNVKPLNNLVKLTTPNLSNITNNNNSSPIINVNLPPSTNIDNNAINNYRKLIPELTNAISEELLGTSRQFK